MRTLFLVMFVVLVAGCTAIQTADQQSQAGSGTTVSPQTPGAGYAGQVLAGNSSLLLDFVKADYDSAVASDKLVVLYFYASWCPICREEVPKMYGAFDELKRNDTIGFRVNYNDAQTDDDERDLAREHGVAYQHTKVFIKDGQRVFKSPESWEKERYLAEINNYAG